MKKSLFIALVIIFVVVVIPFIIVYNSSGFYTPETQSGTPQNTAETTKIPDTTSVSVYIKKSGEVQRMNIDDYLTGVVAAEMPASFELEALKAQAVAARSYLISHINSYAKTGTPDSHNGADVCTDYRHCQAWMSEDERKAAWDASDADSNWDKVRAAVDATSGQVMVYDGEVINAVFHSTSSGRTESAADVWGSDIPYLQSVDSSGDKQSPGFNSEVTLSVDEFKSKAQDALGELDWSGGLFGDICRSNAGGITSITVGGKSIKGTKLREIYGLRSTNADITETDGQVVISARGYGHGVGMSQYGANYLAAEGKSYTDILKTYYTGAEIAENDGK